MKFAFLSKIEFKAAILGTEAEEKNVTLLINIKSHNRTQKIIFISVTFL
jgi:hypothetical protein